MRRNVSLFILAVIVGSQAFAQTEPYKNPDLPIETRVKDLIGRMTIEEKVSQMIDRARPIERLGVPEYNWWNEGLHGVARAGLATVFPQAIGAAATFNEDLILEEAKVIADEFRSKYNEAIRNGEHGRYQGLTVWSPNINIFRDPRWGRGQETYGEDPYLSARMGVAFVRGLQGDHPKYLKTVATPKHYAVHSGPEPLRHTFDVDVSERDFLDTYLPAFEATVKEAHAESVMSVYNRFRGLSGTGSPLLLQDILRDQWGFDGYVVSDCDAVGDIWRTHKLVPTAAEAAAVALKAGCDLNCGNTYSALPEALEKGLVTEADIDKSLTRLFIARFKLGMFDPVEMVPFNNIPYSVTDSPEHRELAKRVSRESMVLLKNENNTLPLSKNLNKVLVVGPTADDETIMFGNYNGIPSYAVTPLEGIKNKLGEDKVVYTLGTYIHPAYPLAGPIDAQVLQTDGKQGLKAEYFANKELQGAPVVTRTEENFGVRTFGNNSSVPAEVERENFSVRWTGTIVPPITGTYEFSIRGDDGYRIWIDENLVLDKWQERTGDVGGGFRNIPEETFTVQLTAQKPATLKIEYFQASGLAFLAGNWKTPALNDDENTLALARQSDAIIFVGGLSPRLEGEEMNVTLEGFNGGDKTSIELPANQVALLKKLKTVGKPLVVVLQNGSAVAVNWSAANADAILEAWYPGQEGGTAIADVLFGDYNPAGRLPVTFYKSVDQLPEFTNYDMKGRTYRYFEGEPLYGFGYGLSYTTFGYKNLKVAKSLAAGKDLTVSVDVTNTGTMDGDEVVQVYVKHINATVPVPLHALKGVDRITIKKGETRTVTFTLTPRELAVISDDNRRVVNPGTIRVFVGGGQPGSNGVSANVKVTGKSFEVR